MDTDLSPDEQERFTALYGSHPQAPAPSSPGFMAGWYKAAAGIPSGLASVGLDVPGALTGQHGSLDEGEVPNPIDIGLFAAGEALKPIHRPIEQLRQSAADYYRPDPQTTGFVGQTLFGATDVATRMGVGSLFGGPGVGLSLASGTTGYDRTKDLEAQGVDPETATESGILIGGSLAAMGGVAGLGKTALMRALTGAGTNVAFGAGTRALDSAILRSHGYEAQAAQQQWNDAHSILADGLIGAAFGLLPHAESGKGAAAAPEARDETSAASGAPFVPADLVDASLVAKNAQHVGDLAPGVPADPRSASAHLDALDTATAQLLDGQPVDVEPLVRDATFVPRPGNIMEHSFADALQEAGISRDDYIESLPTEPNEVIERRFDQQLQDHDQASADYAAIPETLGGKVLNTDIARELSPDYLLDRTRSAAVHEPASIFIKRLFADKLAQEPGDGEAKTVMFTAGGTGAGKTSGIEGVPILRKLRDESHIVYDTNMNKFASADAKIQQALGAGHKVSLVYTYRDPVEALVNGALPRAERQREQFGTGRTVPLAEHYKTHVGANMVIRKLAEKYRDNPDVSIHALDNSRGKGQQQLADLSNLHVRSDTSLRVALSRALRQEYDQGRISEATYRGFSDGEPDEGISGRPAGADGEEVPGRIAGRDGSVPEGAARSEGDLPAEEHGFRAGNGSQRGPARDAGPAGIAADHLNPAAGGVSVSGIQPQQGRIPPPIPEESLRRVSPADRLALSAMHAETLDAAEKLLRKATTKGANASTIAAVRDALRHEPEPMAAGEVRQNAAEALAEGRQPGQPDHAWAPLQRADVPLAGAAKDDLSGGYLDKRVPATVEVDGKTIPTEPAIRLHENVESHLMHELGFSYQAAHAIAQASENHFIEQTHGVDPDKYQAALVKGIEAARKEAPKGDIPADLDRKPYADAGVEHLIGKQPEQGASGARAGVSSADAPDTAPTGNADRARASAGEAQPGVTVADAQGDHGDGLDSHRAGELARARQAAAQRPDATLDDGVSAAAALEAADADVAEAGRQADAVKAAIQCFLSFGSEL